MAKIFLLLFKVSLINVVEDSLSWYDFMPILSQGMIAGFGLFAFRDPNGIRPLVLGSRPATAPSYASPNGTDTPSSMTSLEALEGTPMLDYMFSSESVALDVLGYSDFDDVAPGEAVIITRSGRVLRRQCVDTTFHTFSPCIFEYVYFSRPDSMIDGVSVYRARLAMGEALSKAVIRKLGPDAMKEIDVVVPVCTLCITFRYRIRVELPHCNLPIV
jgi:amidophosphoribosyltransferase